ncbi:MAG: START-like domain-containing protein [Bacteroidota bacterium]|nr:START-like domain-containing protein [Bacteroidota bacterium]MEC8030404.1 START-like domain-containing protein [Bacteroidota bacterium]MEC8407325.1 START-like domain-containing protein [Bacteroidota bacterium]MED5302564.1 START-like domain-containing protein [Bacteroidota bacterium]|tara:strand:- start:640 stop:1020 length:381 start_codon:yes stop_codon:yes gene_type:complete
MDKVRIDLEYIIKTSPTILFNCLSTPSGLSEWFADDVNIKNDRYTFFWDGSEETAILKNVRKSESVKFQWEDDEDEDYFFEMTIRIDDLTKDVALLVTDFAEEGEEDEIQLMWDNNVDNLKKAIGG